MNNVVIYYLGDIGEPGIGGGYSPPGQKGATGMCRRLK
jgi:hypothetical protein